VTTIPLHRVRSYEELDGAQGREVFFRPHRFRAADLEPLAATVMVKRAGSAPVKCALVDISQNGVAFEWAAEAPPVAGDVLQEATVAFDEHVSYRGEAKVGSVRDQGGITVVGVSFAEQLIDIDEVLQLRAVRSWTGRDGAGLSVTARPWSVPGYVDFKSMVAELGLYFEDAEEQMASLESQLAWHVVQGDATTPARDSLLQRIRNEFTAEVVRASEAIDASLRQVPAAHRPPLQAFSLRHLDHFLMQSPWMHRARTKPFGYPGDYEVMRFLYERDFAGPTLFAKALGYSFFRTKAPMATKYRKDLMKRELRAIIESHGPSDRPLRFLSIAAGPAQELVELMTELPELPAPLELVLFEQDKGALSYAYRRLKPTVDSLFPGRVKVMYLHESIKRLLRDSDLFTTFGHFDAIYSCGLFDYLQTRTAIILTRNLLARLAPAGKLYIGNMAPENPSRWYMEFHLEWPLIYRTRPELIDIGQRAAPDAVVRLLEEEAGVNPFIEIHSP
jgi:extracellular factor (EF) 3-hydroxypalmitic acid methyl ester biosynthesis protein